MAIEFKTIPVLHGEAAAHAAILGQGFFVGTASRFEHVRHRHHAAFFFFIAKHFQVIGWFLDGNKLNQFVILPFLVFLGQRMHVRGPYSGHRNAAIVDFFAVIGQFLPQRFPQKLGIPPA